MAPSSRFALAVAAALLAPLPYASADGVYKSVDAQGHVVYSDRAPTAKAEKSELHVIQGNPSEAARAAKETDILNAEETLRKREEAKDSANKSQQELEKQRACQNAKNHYDAIRDVNVLYRLDEHGNRVFYSDAEADARKQQARQAMLAACGQ